MACCGMRTRGHSDSLHGISERAQLGCGLSILPLGPVRRCGLRQQHVEVGKNKLFSRQPFQLLLSKLSNSPNKHRKHWLSHSWLAQASSTGQAQPVLFPFLQPSKLCWVTACFCSLQGGQGALLPHSLPWLCTPFQHHPECHLAQGGIPLQ